MYGTEVPMEDLGKLTAGGVTGQKISAEVQNICREIFMACTDKIGTSKASTVARKARLTHLWKEPPVV